MALTEIAQRVAELARQRRSYWDAELPRRHPDYPVVHPNDPVTPPPPQEHELHNVLQLLTEDAVRQLLLIMYLGRGDFAAGELAENYERVRAAFPQRDWAIRQMLDKAPLAEYLEQGLSRLGQEGIDPNSLESALQSVP